MQTIGTGELKSKLDAGDDIALVEVLDHDPYVMGHIPGALSIPFKGAFADKATKILHDKQQMIVVYCANTECPLSADAAEALSQMGYENVFDYVEGKKGWKEANLPLETHTEEAMRDA